MNLSAEDIVTNVIDELVQLRRSFTGKDVYTRIHNKRIRSSDPNRKLYPTCAWTENQVSRYVRKLFNAQDVSFFDYGTTTTPNGGPLIYFALPYHAKNKKKNIINTLNSIS